MAQPRTTPAVWPLSGWKTIASAAAALLLFLWFVISGAAKILDPFTTAQNMIAKGVPAGVSMPFSLALSAAEMFAGVLVIVPRFRRWGALLVAILLVVFLGYFGFNYAKFKGQDCSCLPLLKEEVSVWFFVRDGVLLLLALMAGLWARTSSGLRSAMVVLGVIAVFAGVSYGVNARHQAAAEGPEWIQVDGKPFPLRQGRVFLYFFDPECTHCDAAARKMATYSWQPDVKVIGVPTEQPQFALDFMRSSGLRGGISNDLAPLRKSFSQAATPYAVVLEEGRRKESISDFESPHPEAELRQLGFIR